MYVTETRKASYVDEHKVISLILDIDPCVSVHVGLYPLEKSNISLVMCNGSINTITWTKINAHLPRCISAACTTRERLR